MYFTNILNKIGTLSGGNKSIVFVLAICSLFRPFQIIFEAIKHKQTQNKYLYCFTRLHHISWIHIVLLFTKECNRTTFMQNLNLSLNLWTRLKISVKLNNWIFFFKKTQAFSFKKAFMKPLCCLSKSPFDLELYESWTNWVFQKNW